MEPQYSILVYSKYSQNCKKLFDLMGESGIDFTNGVGLQMLCIDNNEIRKRIKSNGQLGVSVVPCVLSIFPNGGVEKYDGATAFNWVEAVITRLKPPPPPQIPQPPPRPPPVPLPVQEQNDELARNAQAYKERLEHPPTSPQDRMRQDMISRMEDEHIQPPPNQDSREKKKKKIPARMKPIPETSTSIDDLPLDDGTDRHRLVQQPKRIQQADGQYLEDDTLFGGDPVDYRREPGNVVKQDRRSQGDTHGIMAKMKAIEAERNSIEEQLGSQARRPIESRRP